MQDSQSESPPIGCDSSRSVLDLLHDQLLAGGDMARGLDDFLSGLATAFHAAGAGLATIAAGGPLPQARVPGNAAADQRLYPWQADRSWLEQINSATETLVITAPETSFLLAPWDGSGIPSGLVWLEDSAGREWSAADKAALSLAASLLARRVGNRPNTPRWLAQLDRKARQRDMALAGQVTRRLAHDFGNVMTGILGFVELALAQNVTPGTSLHTYLTEAHKAAQNGALFTHQLRLLSRRQSPSSQATDLSQLFIDEEKRYRTLWGPNLPLAMQAEADLPPVALDPEPLRQALHALLENARDAVLAVGSGCVEVSAKAVEVTAAGCRDWFGDARPGRYVEIQVRDTGAGLDPDVAQRLFAEPFFSTKTRKRGFGLTLALSIVTSHRGGIDLQPAPHAGSVARLLLPVAAAAVVAKPQRVLVVDDDPLILQFVCTTLERAGYQVQKASSAADAFQSFTSATPDLVLSDVAMPRENGIELARRLLNHDANVRLVFMSGKIPSDFADSEFVARQFQLLAKPFRPDGLLKVVRDALDRPARGPGAQIVVPARA